MKHETGNMKNPPQPPFLKGGRGGIILLLASCLLLPLSAFAYPNDEKAVLDLGLNQATGGIAITSDNRYLILAYTETLKRVDLGTWALTSSQPAALSEDDDTDGTIGGLAYVSSSSKVYAAQDDGDILSFSLSSITDDPSSSTMVSGSALTLMAVDTATSPSMIYVLDNTNDIVYFFQAGSSSTSGSINLKVALPSVTFSVKDMIFVPDAGAAGELYIGTDAGRVLYAAAGGSTASVIDIDSTNGDDCVALAATPDGSKVYAVNSNDKSAEVITTSTHTKGTAVDLSENSGLTDIVITEVSNPSGADYAFVSGQGGLSVFDTYDDDVFDFDTSNDAGTNDPIDIDNYGYLLASSDGYVYMSTGGGDISVITDKPYITFSTPTYADSAGASAVSLGSGGTVTLTFQSDVAGTYEVRAGGNIDESGTLLTDTSSATSGSVSAATDTAVTFAYDTNSSALSEGSNDIFVFVTDSNSLVGRAAEAITVDTPPTAITINSTGFGNGRVYVTFSRLTASDIDHYNIYADTDAATVQTKSTASATATQPASGSTVIGVVSGLTNGTTYYIAVEAVDASSNTGPRAYLLSDGTAASAMPQVTVGPAGLTGETGGCSLIRKHGT